MPKVGIGVLGSEGCLLNKLEEKQSREDVLIWAPNPKLSVN